MAWTLYSAKFGGAAPPRVLFLIFLALTCSPFVAALVSRVPVLFFIPSTLLIFLLYPLFSPHNLPYNRDVIYNFQVSQDMLQFGNWVSGRGSGAALIQSSYPGSNIFNAEAAVLLGVPLDLAYQWIIPIFRFLIIPACVYAISVRLFEQTTAVLGVFLYLGTGTILFNVPVQQEFATPFIALSLVLLTYLLGQTESSGLSLRVALAFVSSLVILIHHWSSYVFGAWLAGITFLPMMLRRAEAYPALRPARVLARYLIVLLLYVYIVAAPVVLKHFEDLRQALDNLVSAQPAPGRVSQLGRTFLPYELAWIILSIALLMLFSLLALRRHFSHVGRTFVTVNLFIVLILLIVTLPFLGTSFYFLALRIGDYSGLLLGPASAWWIVHELVPWLRRRIGVGGRTWPHPSRRALPYVAGALVLALIFMGGSLVPVTTRDYFTKADQLDVDSPLFIDHNAYDAAQWARAHMNASHAVWGDDLAYSVFGGFGRFHLRFSQYVVFNGTNISSDAWRALDLGDYIVTDVYMTVLTPTFRGLMQPIGPLDPAQLEKFRDPRYFATAYQDSTFTIYVVISRPALPPA